jgi:glucose/arabinose dehydrogenase
MFNSQVHRKLLLALAAAGVLTVAGCSQSATEQASNTAKTAGTAKPAAATKPAGVAKPAGAAKPATAPKAAAVAKTQEPATMVTVPKGTAISATVGQTLASDKNKVGDTFAASLNTPIEVEGKTVIPKGAHVTGRIVTVKKHELKVALASVVIHGKSYPLDTNSIAGPKSEAKKDVKDTDKAKAKTSKDVTLLTAKSKLTFKLAKPVIIPVKG